MTQLEQKEGLWHREDFIDYLEGTFIPDLYASGREEAGKNFRIAVKFMQNHLITAVDLNAKEWRV